MMVNTKTSRATLTISKRRAPTTPPFSLYLPLHKPPQGDDRRTAQLHMTYLGKHISTMMSTVLPRNASLSHSQYSNTYRHPTKQSIVLLVSTYLQVLLRTLWTKTIVYHRMQITEIRQQKRLNTPSIHGSRSQRAAVPAASESPVPAGRRRHR